ncbi:hypothetical protein Tco_1310492 [Tanacetum coccineum]
MPIKSKIKPSEKNIVHAISIIDFSKDDPFSGSTTNTLLPSSSPVKISDNLEKFADELAPLDSLPPGNDVSTLKKDFHERTTMDARLKSSSSFTLTSPENEVNLKNYLGNRFRFLLDFDSPFTAELSASVTLNSLGNEDKVFKPGILVYHDIHDKNLVTLEENLKENISSGTLLIFKEPSFLLPPPEPPDKCLNFEPILVMKNVVMKLSTKAMLKMSIPSQLSFGFFFHTSLTPMINPPFAFSFRYGYIKNHKKTVKNGQARTRKQKSTQKPEAKPRKSQSLVKKSKKSQLMVNRSQPQEDKTQNDPNKSLNFSKVTKIVPGP